MADNERNLTRSDLNKEYPTFDNRIETFKDRLKVLVDKWPSIRAYARAADISETALRNYLKGRLPQIDVVDRLAEAGGVTNQYLAFGIKPAMVIKETSISYQSNVNGFELISEYIIEDGAGVKKEASFAFSQGYLSSRKLNVNNLVIVRASGNSMEPTIEHDTNMLVDTSDKHLKDGDICVLRFGDELSVKRIQKRFDGGVELLSNNKEYKDQIVKADELEQLTVVGKVVWIGKDLN